jgi:hypothetical protein
MWFNYCDSIIEGTVTVGGGCIFYRGFWVSCFWLVSEDTIFRKEVQVQLRVHIYLRGGHKFTTIYHNKPNSDYNNYFEHGSSG